MSPSRLWPHAESVRESHHFATTSSLRSAVVRQSTPLWYAIKPLRPLGPAAHLEVGASGRQRSNSSVGRWSWVVGRTPQRGYILRRYSSSSLPKHRASALSCSLVRKVPESKSTGTGTQLASVVERRPIVQPPPPPPCARLPPIAVYWVLTPWFRTAAAARRPRSLLSKRLVVGALLGLHTLALFPFGLVGRGKRALPLPSPFGTCAYLVLRSWPPS